MKLKISDIINRHKNFPALVIAHGPSYNKHRSKIQEYKDKGIIVFDCNEWEYFQSVAPNYWVVANNEYTVQNFHATINAHNVPYLYADSVDLTPREYVEKTLTTDYLPYDQRHNKGMPCTPHKDACCDNIIPGRLTLSEELLEYTHYNILPKMIGTVALNMLVFAILMGCNPIYFIGIDLDYRQGYAKLQSSSIDVPVVDNNIWLEYVIPNLEIINNAAKNIGIKIININKNAWFDTFEKGDINI
jgi:hypothetical protein